MLHSIWSFLCWFFRLLISPVSRLGVSDSVPEDPLNMHPAWVDLPSCDPLSVVPGYTTVQFVSRHSLSEDGIHMDWLGERIRVCGAGEYHRIRRGVLHSTQEKVECVVWDYKDPFGNSATYYLVASPDTEHGDDVLLDNCSDRERPQLLASFSRFVRRPHLDIERERWGQDINLLTTS